MQTFDCRFPQWQRNIFPKHFFLESYFSVTFDPSPITVKREHRQERSLLTQFQHLGNFILEKGKGKAALLEAASLGAQRPSATAREGATTGMEAGHEGVLAGIAHDLQSEPKLVGMFSPLSYTCPFVGLHRPGFTRRPRPQGSRRKATPATTAVLPLLVLDLFSPLFLPPGLFSGPAGVGVFLGITSLNGHRGRHLNWLPTRLSAVLPSPRRPGSRS